MPHGCGAGSQDSRPTSGHLLCIFLHLSLSVRYLKDWRETNKPALLCSRLDHGLNISLHSFMICPGGFIDQAFFSGFCSGQIQLPLMFPFSLFECRNGNKQKRHFWQNQQDREPTGPHIYAQM